MSGASTQGTGGTSHSASSGPEMTFVINERSSTERASGPSVFMWRTARGIPGSSGMCPVFGTRRSVGFKANRPQKCAGVRTDPARSLPTSKAESPAATAAAPPPVDPPGVRSRSQGLLVRPKIGLSAR